MADSRQQTEEQKFRDSFLETLAVIDRLSPYCQTVEELRDVVQLALDSPGQLRLLIATMTTKR